MLTGYFIIIACVLVGLISYSRYLQLSHNDGHYRLNGIFLSGFTILGGLLLYLIVGAPFLPDMPRNIGASLTDNKIVAPQLDAETLAQAQQMSEEEQTAMIQGMVAGLAEKLEENPNDIDGLKRLARAYLVLGEAGKYVDILEKARTLTPNDEGLLLALTRSLRKQNQGKDTQRSLVLLQQILAQNPNQREALLFLGIHQWHAGNQAEAQKYFEKTLNNLPKDSDSYKQLESYINKVIE